MRRLCYKSLPVEGVQEYSNSKRGQMKVSRRIDGRTAGLTAISMVIALGCLTSVFSASAQDPRSSPTGLLLDPKHARPIAGYEIVRSTTPDAVQPGSRYGWNAECPAPKL